MTQITNYNETRQQFMSGEITLEQWQEFCFEVLEEILEENKDVIAGTIEKAWLPSK